MNFEDFDIQTDLSINRFQLDLEAISLPSIYFRYSDAVREAKEMVSEKKDKLEAVLAERNIAIREECSQSGKKVTEASVTALVNSDPQVLDAKKELREANAIFGRLQVAVSALEVKKNGIDNLVKLYCNAYYANKGESPNSDFKSDMVGAEMRKKMRPVPVVNKE